MFHIKQARPSAFKGSGCADLELGTAVPIRKKESPSHVAKRKRARNQAQGITAPDPYQRKTLKSVPVAQEYWPLATIIVLASVLMFANLGNQSLWEDEAETALLAKTVLTHGVPLDTDGRNFFSVKAGADYDKKSHMHKWHPWLQFYLAAASFAVLGPTTLAARLPFTLFGVGTCVLMYFFGRRMLGSRRAGVVAALLVLASVPFLLLVRQCRYYSLDVFFATLGLYGYYNMLEKRKWSGLTFFLGAFFLFHSHYLHCAVLLGTVTLHSLIWRRDRLLAVAAVSGLVGLLNVPWIIWFAGMAQQMKAHGTPLHRLQTSGPALVTKFERFIFPPLALILVVPTVIASWARSADSPDQTEKRSRMFLFCCCSSRPTSWPMP